jgi:PHP family Zn ribbon phosphoesterase
LGIDSRDLLAMLLDTDDRAMLIPAHIWTPWFSALGEKSGFDSIEECYRDMAAYIPAVETGLSSNPPKNWAVESLDTYSIVSSSDAHSPDKIGREAVILDVELSYSSLRSALSSHSPLSRSPAGHGRQGGPAVAGTVEFFPEEGKYHYDGHRNCGVFLEPEEAAEKKYLCPVCGKSLTRGVMGRVMDLADSAVNEDEAVPSDYWPTNRRPYFPLIPLREITAELIGTGTASVKAETAYYRLIEKGGSELAILMDIERPELEKLSIPEFSGETLARAILKMRAGDVSIRPGYDGEYGKVKIFDIVPEEKNLFGEMWETTHHQQTLSMNKKRSFQKTQKTPVSASVPGSEHNNEAAAPALDPDQEQAVSYNGRAAVIIAGPGTGKTRVLTERIARIIREGTDPASILALTFTVKAAA